MAKLNDEWVVQPHGPVEEIDDRLLSVAGDISMPLGNFPRRMTVVGLEGGRSAIWSAMPLREAEMQRVLSLGEPAFLIVPGIAHRLDIRAWKARFPNARVLCPPGAREKVAEAVAVDATDDVLGDPAVRFETVPGVDGREGLLWIDRGGRVTLVVNDILANVRHPNGIGANIMARLFGFGVKRPAIPWVGKRAFVTDEDALRAGYRTWAATPGLTRIIVSHGDIIDRNPRQVLEDVAATI